VFNALELVQAASDALSDRADALDTEHAVRGIDALPELDLHPILAQGLRTIGLGVVSEQPYPGPPGSRRGLTERERCDLVLLPEPGLGLVDPVVERRERDRAAGTLFESVAAAARAEPGRARPDDAFWLEIKVVGQFCYTAGVPGANRSYATDLVGSLTLDLRKLARDPVIVHAGVLMVLFTRDRATAEHDLAAAICRCLDRDVPAASPESDGLAIADRIGNAWCHVALVRARPGG